MAEGVQWQSCYEIHQQSYAQLRRLITGTSASFLAMPSAQWFVVAGQYQLKARCSTFLLFTFSPTTND